MSDFFRFPSTPHLAWLSHEEPRSDKVFHPSMAKEFLENEVVVEEKLDGANLGFSYSNGRLHCQNRGQYLTHPYSGQFSRLNAWLAQHEASLRDNLTPNLILFGEWCAAKHSIAYHQLRDWFYLFDVYDRKTQKFWSSIRRNELAKQIGILCVPHLETDKMTLPRLEAMLMQKSKYANHMLEGVVVRSEDKEYCLQRAKLVRPSFTQSIDEHWRKKTIVWNRVKY